MRIILLISLLWVTCSSAFTAVTNTLHFTVYVGSDKAGTLVITKHDEGEKTSYHLHSTVRVNLLVGIDVEEDIKDVFVKGLLQQSEHTRFVNNTQRIKNSLAYINKKYVLSRNGKENSTLLAPIRVSIASLYFAEPSLPTHVYSQGFQQLLALKSTKQHTYSLKLPNGTTTEFQYEKGELLRVISDNAWGEIRFERVK